MCDVINMMYLKGSVKEWWENSVKIICSDKKRKILSAVSGGQVQNN